MAHTGARLCIPCPFHFYNAVKFINSKANTWHVHGLHISLSQEATGELRVAVSSILVLHASYFGNDGMQKLQRHLELLELPAEFVLLALGTLASGSGVAIPICGPGLR